MKRLLIALLFLTACKKSVHEFPGTWYGQRFDSERVTMSLAEVSDLELIADTLKRVYQGTVHDACHLDGCWMTMENVDGAVIRVYFKDEEFRVPHKGEIIGKLVLVNGVLSQKDISKTEDIHLEEELGFSHEEAVRRAYHHLEYWVEASGVFIQK